ncbi:MAG: hypothetical protein CMJ23_04715 [Phycisphaerae bacterium]|nr:hypothetical protein [Phycisphaerae bacterium]
MNPSSPFPQPGVEYSRVQISNRLGGGIQQYLPSRNGRVTAVCVDPEKNPDAPAEILVGTGPGIIRAGCMLSEQDGSLPVFLKRGNKRWESIGDYRVTRWSEEPTLLSIKGRQRKGRAVTRVIYLERD